MKDRTRFDQTCQVAIPALTVGGFALTGLKYPEWGLIVSLIAQPFWLYSSYKAYKEAGQGGILLSSVIMTFVILLGIINYWLL